MLRAAILRALDEEAIKVKAGEMAAEMAGMAPMSHAVAVMEGLAR